MKKLFNGLIDGNLTIVITLQKVLRALLEGGYYKPFPGITAGIIRMRVLFEGGSYMRKYGRQVAHSQHAEAGCY